MTGGATPAPELRSIIAWDKARPCTRDMGISTMRNMLSAAAMLALLLAPDLARAQGVVGGATSGAAAGRNAAGPIGGVVGGAVGGAVGGVRGVLGLPRRHHLPSYRTYRHHHLPGYRTYRHHHLRRHPDRR